MRISIRKKHADKIKRINAHIEQGPAGQRRFHYALLVCYGVRQVCMDRMHRSDPLFPSAGHSVKDHPAAWHIPRPYRLGTQHPGPV